MSGLTNYISAAGYDLSYVFHPINDIPAVGQNLTFSGNNTFSGINTFSGKTIFSQLRISCGTISADPTTLTAPLLNFYQVTSAATNITIPNPSSSNNGTFIIFKHTGASSIAIFSSSIYGEKVVTPATVVNVPNAKVVIIVSNGSSWFIYYTTV